MISLLIASFIAGILTILAPCILPIIPVIVGGSIASSSNGASKRPYVIIASLGVAVFVFTLLLKSTTALLGIPPSVWQFVSGIIVLGLGISYLFPKLWEYLSLSSNAGLSSQQALSSVNGRSGTFGAVLTGAALGPVFASCSPTYLFIVAAVLPAEFISGLVYLLAYVLGLCLALLGISLAGRRLIRKLGWTLNPNGWFRRGIGALMVVVGIMVLLGGDKALQTFIIDQGLYAPLESFENSLR
jgi:cytochrome c-type biogenesis protein